MSSDAITVVVGLVGVALSVLIAYVFYRVGQAASGAQVRDLTTQNSELGSKVDDLRRLLAGYVDRMSQASWQVSSRSEPGSEGVAAPSQLGADPDETKRDTAVVGLVRTSLGVLQDERGEVELPRLLDEVGRAVGPDRLHVAEDELRRLRADGIVEWEGGEDDLSHIGMVRVRPGKGRTRPE